VKNFQFISLFFIFQIGSPFTKWRNETKFLKFRNEINREIVAFMF
jgi:hypothetical protein